MVLAGGRGSERDVSVASGKRVAEALCRLKLKTALIDPISEVLVSEGHFCSDFGKLTEVSSLFYNADGKARKKRSDLIKPRLGGDGGCITESVIELCKTADAVFIMLHGGIGENGRLQALFETLGIKYFGSSPEGSAAAMDKVLSKRIFESVGILTPLYTVYVRGGEGLPVPPRYPCVVKPASEGSSVGVTPVRSPEELKSAVNRALESCDKVIMEEMIKGREITVGMLSDKALAVTEIVPKGGFYDYESKYTAGKTLEITPARLSEKLTCRAMRLAERVHTALGLSGFSRIDMIVESKTDLIYVLEANTVPGMTKTSLLPLAAEYAGIGFTELCGKMAGL